MPGHAVHQTLQAALARYRAGNPRAAEKLCRQILSREPNNVDALNVLGGCLYLAGNLNEAIEVYQRITALKPNLPEAHNNLGGCLQRSGRVEEAIAAFKTAIRLKGDFPAAKSNVAAAYFEWGATLLAGQHTAEALEAFQQAVAFKPDFIKALEKIGACLGILEQFDAAVATFQTILRLRPDMPEALNNLGIALQFKGQLDEAIASFRRAIELKPDLAEAHCNLGAALKDAGQPDEAIAALRQAIRLKPDLADAHDNLGNALKNKEQLDEAVAAHRQAIRLNPDHAKAHNNLGNALKDMGQLEEAVAAYRQAVRLRPDRAGLHSNLIYTLHFHPGYDARMIYEEHRNWNQQHAEPLKKFIQPYTNDRNPDRRLRIGYLSPDFREHVVGQNLFPLFREHDHRQTEIFCYANVARPDALTEQFRRYADVWRSIVGLSDSQAVDLIRQDRIDILVDLTLHMAKNRLAVFAHKPAPVQATFAGYPGSTGLGTIDYRLTDPYLDPPGLNDRFYSETSVRLPDSFWCYDPLVGEFVINPLPAQTDGHVTFGCLNNFCKINEPVLRLWARVLKTVDRSRLMILCPEGSQRQALLDLMQREGISPDRIELIAGRRRLQYLELYHRIDVGLDSFPYNGHTTSLDSFWMGVPVVTLVGQTVVGRAGLSQLTNLGLPELIAQTPEQYVQIATDLAGDLPRLAELRRTLRARMQASPLMDAPRFARNIEAAYRQMWRNWCATGGSPSLQCSAELTLKEQLESGLSHHQAGRLAEAERIYRQVLAQQPNHSDALHLLGVLSGQTNRLDAAVNLIRRAIAICSTNATYHGDLGKFLGDRGQPEEAIASYRQAIRLNPDLAKVHYNLGVALKDKEQLDEAIACYRQAIRLKPDYAEAHSNLAIALKDTGQLEEAVASFRQAIGLKPDLAGAHSNLVFTLPFYSGCDARMILEENLRWNRQHAEPLQKFIQPHTNDRNPDRRLRIGYVSPDFREHCQAMFTIPLLSNHDRKAFEIFCYAHVGRPDAVTERIGGYVDVWRSIVGMTDAEAARKIHEDRIDILVDLTMHMGDNRVAIFARKPAPVQAAWLAYPGTTGLSAMDYRLTDPYLDPPGLNDQFYSETSIRLRDSFWCYDPLVTDLLVNPLPAQTDGHVTFGCLNNFCKINEPVLRLWAQVLKSVDRSRLMILSPEGSPRQVLLDRLQREGISPDRIELISRRPRRQYLELYHRIDVGLDTFPSNGHTTSLDSFWMGVPVITLVGQTVVGRAGLSQLTNLGLPELIARTPEQYVQIATDLARDLPRLAELRRTLRARMEASPLMDGPRFARSVEAAYRQMWRSWCEQGGNSNLQGPDYDVHQALQAAVAQYQAGNPLAAEKLCRQVLSREPNNVDALNVLGGCLYLAGNLNEAIEVYQRIAALKPELPEAHNNLGGCLQRTGRVEEAIAAFKTAIRLKGDFPVAKSNLAAAYFEWGNALSAKGQTAEALNAFQQAVALKSDFIEAHSNLGAALKDVGRLDEAIVACRQAIRLKPDYAEAHSNLGNALADVGQLDEAIAAYRRAIELKADFAQAHWNYALLLLFLGEFEEGWKEFEWRLRMPRMRLAREFPQPRWTGQEARGKTILLFAEGGFGDAMHFIRYAPLLAERGATVLLECQAELAPLLSRVKGISAVFVRGERLPAFDWQTPLQSLPLAFGTTLKTIPAEVPYLSAPPQRIEQWAKRLAGDSSFKVGLTWAGSARRDERSCPLATLAPLAAVPGVTFYGVQKGPEANQPVPPGLRLIQMGDELYDFADTAALVSNLDLVISVDTSVVHLAGGLGRMVWTLIPRNPGYQWLRDRTDSPWYPTMRLFRQRAAGDWLDVIQRVANRLEESKSKT